MTEKIIRAYEKLKKMHQERVEKMTEKENDLQLKKLEGFIRAIASFFYKNKTDDPSVNYNSLASLFVGYEVISGVTRDEAKSYAFDCIDHAYDQKDERMKDFKCFDKIADLLKEFIEVIEKRGKE